MEFYPDTLRVDDFNRRDYVISPIFFPAATLGSWRPVVATPWSSFRCTHTSSNTLEILPWPRGDR